MLYLSGIHALNIEDSLETCGDWHTSALDWSHIELCDSSKSKFGDWGIETGKTIPEHDGELFNVANTLRAVIDLMQEGMIGYLKGFRDDFFCTEKYDEGFFEKVVMLKDSEYWGGINCLMKREFMFKWDNFLSKES